MPNFPEAVHIELADKGREVSMFEVYGENIFGESGDIFDIKTILRVSPSNNRLNLSILDNERHTSSISMSLEMKRGI